MACAAYLLQIIFSLKFLGQTPRCRHLNARHNLFMLQNPACSEHSVRSFDDSRIAERAHYAATAYSLFNSVTLGDVDPKIVFQVHFINQQGIH